MQLNSYLHFNGQCEEAFQFYARIFGGKIELMTPFGGGEGQMQVPAGWAQKIMHARLAAAGQVLMGSDPPPPHYSAPQGFAVSVTVKEPAEAARIFNALAENGNVRMPLGKTFWSPAFGMVTDRFAIPWMVNCE